MDHFEITRGDFEKDFGIVAPGDAVGATLFGYGNTVHFHFVGLRQYEIQELEKLYKLQGDQ